VIAGDRVRLLVLPALAALAGLILVHGQTPPSKQPYVNNAIVAPDGATGKQVWSHPVEGNIANRGINYWENKDRSDRRLIFGAGQYLHEINARTGITINTFGDDGRVNMRTGTPRPLGSPSATPGRVFENRIIVGSQTGEGYGSAPGDLRKLLWTFHTIPHPGEFGYETWPPDAWKYVGGVNTWGELSIDERRGIAYFPLGSPTHDSLRSVQAPQAPSR